MLGDANRRAGWSSCQRDRPFAIHIWHNLDMKSHVDKFGRLVLPQPLRRRLNLRAGDEVEIEEDDGLITIRPIPHLSTMTREEDGLLVLHAELAPSIDPLRLGREERLRYVHCEA